jgi:hypothetical protein
LTKRVRLGLGNGLLEAAVGAAVAGLAAAFGGAFVLRVELGDKLVAEGFQFGDAPLARLAVCSAGSVGSCATTSRCSAKRPSARRRRRSSSHRACRRALRSAVPAPPG